MVCITEEMLIDNRDEREKYMGRVDILDKVKGLFLIPVAECMTMTQLASYYEVSRELINWHYQHNKDEFIDDGAVKYSIGDIKGLADSETINKTFRQMRGRIEVTLANNTVVVIPNAGITLFPRRAVLRMGMMLRESAVAKEVRSQLLNTFESATDAQKTLSIDEEKALINDIAEAYASGDIDSLLIATSALDGYRKRYIIATEQNINNFDEIKPDANFYEILLRYSSSFGYDHGRAYNYLYDELMYTHHIHLRKRGGKPYIQWLKPSEYNAAYSSIISICRNHGINYASIFNNTEIEISNMPGEHKKELFLELCEGRHDIPQAVDGAVFGKNVDPTNIKLLESIARKALAGCAKLNLYTTGLTVAQNVVVKVCRECNIELVIWHYNNRTGDYYPQTM